MSALSVSLQGASPPAERNSSAFLLGEPQIEWALAQVESGHLRRPDNTRGASGEVSRFQIMPEVWKSYSRSRNYSDPQVAWTVASRILKDRQAWFIRSAGRQPTAFDLYVMWNKPGLYERVAFNRRRLPAQLLDVAKRFETLVHGTSIINLTSR